MWEPRIYAWRVHRVWIARSPAGGAVVGGVLPGWSLVLLLFLLCVEVLRVLDGEQLAFGAPVSSGSGSFSSRCVDGEAMVSAMRVGDFVLRLRLRCVAVSFCGGGSELVGWCVRVARWLSTLISLPFRKNL